MHEHYLFWPYASGQPVVDAVLWGFWVFLFGFLFTLGMRVGNKIP